MIHTYPDILGSVTFLEILVEVDEVFKIYQEFLNNL
jgi:hypothetical protein